MTKKQVIVLFSILGVIAIIVLLWLSLSSIIFIKILGVNVGFTPFKIINYLLAYPENTKVMKTVKISFFLAFAIYFVIAFFIFLLMKKKQKLFGDASLASFKEIVNFGLMPKINNIKNGLLIGKLKRSIIAPFQFLWYAGAQFVILIAPTRSGKGVSFVIPNLLMYPNSAVVLDVKQENWDLTSKYRKEVRGNECYLFNPMAKKSRRSHKYNPLDYISRDPILMVHDVQKIGQMLYPIPKEGDDIFTSTARSLFNGIVLMLIETNKPVNLGNVLDQTAIGDGQKYLGDIIKEQKAKGEPLSLSCERALNEYVSMASDNTRSGCIGNFRTALQLWNNPLVREATSSSDFYFTDLRRKKMTIYLGVTPDNLEDLQPILNLFFQQLINVNLEELPEQNPDLKYDVLLLMDEFTAIGKIPVLNKGVAYIAGYGLRLAPIIQSTSQLISVYGEHDAESFIQNIACYMVFPPSKKDMKSAKELSESIGYVTVKSQSRDIRKRSQGSESDHQRALFLPQELTSLGQDKSIIIIDHLNPIIATKPTYYNDDFFLDMFAEISGKKVSGFDIKKLALHGHYALEIPLLNLGEENNYIEEVDETHLGKNLLKYLKSTDAILNTFNFKELLIKKANETKLDNNDIHAVNSYIDSLLDDCLYTDSIELKG